MEGPKLWEIAPDIWPTKAKFFAWLRGALRRGLWEKQPLKLQFKNEQCQPPPEGYTGRARSGKECALSGEWTGKSALEVDHIEGHKSLTDWEDLAPFIFHLLATKDKMQLVSKPAHKIKSYAERMGISYEEAVIEKQLIALMKAGVEQQKRILLENGFNSDEISNAGKRKALLRDLIEKGVI